METLLIQSAIDGSEQQWFVSEPGAQVRRGDPADLGGIKGRKGSRDVIWLVRSQDLTLLSKSIPSKRASDLVRAVPYAVEEELAVQDIESCSFAVSRAGNADEVCIAVVHGATLQAGFQRLCEAGVRPVRVLPDVLALDWEEGTWSVLLDDEHALVRTGFMAGYAVDRQNLAWALRRSLVNTPEPDRPDRIRVWGGALDAADFALPVEEMPGQRQNAFDKGIAELPPLNLLGQADAVQSLGVEERRYLKLAAGVLVGVLVVLWASARWQLQDLKGYEQQLGQAINSSFRRAAPEAKRIVNPRVQLEQKVQRLRSQRSGSEGLLSQLADLASGLASEKDFELKKMSYQTGTFVLRLNTTSVQQLDAIKSAIERNRRYQVTIESVDKQNNLVVGTLRVRDQV